MVDRIANDIRGKQRFLLLSLLFVTCLMVRVNFNNDTYWLINSGRYVMANGIPNIEPFTLHQGLHFVMQQWLAATVFAVIYDMLNSAFLYVLVAVINSLIIYSIFRLCMRTSDDNFMVSFTIAFAVSIPIYLFMVLRPYIFSLLLFSIELNLLESGIQKYNSDKIINEKTNKNDVIAHINTWRHNPKYRTMLIGLPIVSLLLINFHAAMWLFFFVLTIPYFIDGFRFNFFGLKSDGYPLLTLSIATVLSFAVGWINPYGFEGMTYLFRSYGNEFILSNISEMIGPDFKNAFGIFVFLIYLISVVVFCVNYENKIRLRYALLMIGTGYMGLSSIRSLNLFFVCGIPFLAYKLKTVQILKIPNAQPRFPWLQYVLMTVLVIILGSFFYIRAAQSEKNNLPFSPAKSVDFIKKNLSKESIRLFTGYNTGGFVEFEGLNPFIDARADVFFKSNNRKEDILEDYFNVCIGKMHYQELIDKYNLTHFLVGKTDILLYVYLSEDPNFELLFTDGDYKLFALKAKDCTTMNSH